MEDFYEWFLKNHDKFGRLNFFAMIRQYCNDELLVLLYGNAGEKNKDGYNWIWKNWKGW
jgi:hypothetical protein